MILNPQRSDGRELLIGSAFTRKLENWTRLSDEDRAGLETISGDVENVERNQNLIREGDDPQAVFLLIEGWAFRYKILPDGKRQIVAFLLPGDLCDVHIFILDHMDHGIAMLSRGKVVRIPRETILRVIEERPAVSRALWWTTLVDEAVLREWLVNIGGRNAYARTAHLLCELYVRMENVGLVDKSVVNLPLTQIDLAEALGLTPVHVNRMLKRLCSDGLISYKSQEFIIHDVEALKTVAGFDPGYLHGRTREPRPFDGPGDGIEGTAGSRATAC